MSDQSGESASGEGRVETRAAEPLSTSAQVGAQQAAHPDEVTQHSDGRSKQRPYSTEHSSQHSALSTQHLAERLAAFLAEQPTWRAALPVRAVARVGQGQSNLTFRVTLATGDVILRRPPPGPLPPSAHDVLREYRVLQALTGSAVPVPRPLVACADPAVLGAPFYLMEALDGDAIRFELPPALGGPAEESQESVSGAAGQQAHSAGAGISCSVLPGHDEEASKNRIAPLRRAIGEQLVDALAALHTTDPAAVGLAELGRPSGYLARQLRRWQGQLDYARVRPAPDLDWVTAWLAEHLPPDAGPACVVHGDYKLDNAIFSHQPPPRLLGVVDWELATLGDPLADLGWLLAFWREAGDPPPELKILPRVTEQPGFSTRAELAARYAARTGRPLPDLRYYVVFALWKMAVLLEGHWARHVRGTAGDFNFAYLETAGPAFWARLRHTASENQQGV